MNSKGQKLSTLVGFVVLGLSPSYVDWQNQPQQRWKMAAFYLVGVLLIYFGVFGD